jgi:hypothetical protein
MFDDTSIIVRNAATMDDCQCTVRQRMPMHKQQQQQQVAAAAAGSSSSTPHSPHALRKCSTVNLTASSKLVWVRHNACSNTNNDARELQHGISVVMKPLPLPLLLLSMLLLLLSLLLPSLLPSLLLLLKWSAQKGVQQVTEVIITTQCWSMALNMSQRLQTCPHVSGNMPKHTCAQVLQAVALMRLMKSLHLRQSTAFMQPLTQR